MTTALTTTNQVRDFVVDDVNRISKSFQMCRRASAMADNGALDYHRGNVLFHLRYLHTDMKWMSLGWFQ